MTRRLRDTSKKRNEILDAAIKGFMAEGYHNCSMDRISELANASKRTVYNHFPSKDELFQAVIQRYLGEQEKLLLQIRYRADTPLADQLRQFADAEIFLVATPERRGLSKVLSSVFMYDTELAITMKSRYCSSMECFCNWLAQAAEDKGIQAMPWELAGSMFYSMVQGGITWPALFYPDPDMEMFQPIKAEIIATFLQRYFPVCD